MEKMTRREFMEAIVNGEMNDGLKAFAAEEIVKIDAENQKRREKAAEKAAENAPILEKIKNEILSDKPITATQVGEYLEMSPQKATAMLRKLVETGVAKSEDVHLEGVKGKRKGYTLV